jgi:hypothetical protein
LSFALHLYRNALFCNSVAIVDNIAHRQPINGYHDIANAHVQFFGCATGLDVDHDTTGADDVL